MSKVTITHDCSWFLPLSRYCKLPQMIPHRKWSPEWTANDDPRPQVIPIVDRKWSREENQNGLDSSYWIIVSRLLSQQKVLEGHVHGSAHAHLLKCCFSAWHAVRLCKQYDHVIMLSKKYTLRSLRYMWVGSLTDRINNKLERSNLINEHALNREPVPLTKLNTINK